MGKSILVIDAPENCGRCPFCKGLNACKIMKFLNGDKITTIYTVDKQIFDGTRPDWCPLHDMTERADHPNYCDNGRYDKGWNDCLDHILNEQHANAVRRG